MSKKWFWKEFIQINEYSVFGKAVENVRKHKDIMS